MYVSNDILFIMSSGSFANSQVVVGFPCPYHVVHFIMLTHLCK